MENSIKKIPNISHIPQSSNELWQIINFLKNPKEEVVFYDFLRSGTIIKSRNLVDRINNKMDSTERKWKNHLKKLNIISEKKVNGTSIISHTKYSRELYNKKISITEYIKSTIVHTDSFNNFLNDLIKISFLKSSFISLSELYLFLKNELNYVSRDVSAIRNISGMIKYMTLGNLVQMKKKEITLSDSIFFAEEEYAKFERTIVQYVIVNSNYGGYASLKELSNYLISQFEDYDSVKINLILRRIINESDLFLFQSASSNKEIGIVNNSKNILFIRLK